MCICISTDKQLACVSLGGLHLLQVASGEPAFPHHSALLNNDSIAGNDSATDSGQSASDQHLQGAVDLGDLIELQDSISSSVQERLNGAEANAAGDSAPHKAHAQLSEGNSASSDRNSHEAVESNTHVPYQSEADDLASAAQSEPRQSVPQEVAAGSAATSVADEGSDKRFVSQQQMDKSGHADAFAKIMESIPDHIKNAISGGDAAANTEAASPVDNQRADSASPGSSHSSGAQHHQHAEL